jgi:hypothetical protein
MKYRLDDGAEIQIDEADLPTLEQHRWHLKPSNACSYVVATVDRRQVRLHRLILNAGLGEWVDHVNGDTLDNRRSNLRIVTADQSRANQGGWGLTSYRGVYYDAEKGRWRARIHVNGSRRHLGYFDTAGEAAAAWDEAAEEAWGEYARLNLTGSVQPG